MKNTATAHPPRLLRHWNTLNTRGDCDTHTHTVRWSLDSHTQPTSWKMSPLYGEWFEAARAMPS